ncbi:hypothetical protein TRFO_25538 [Tritrichomonas foetus]|uniref:RRM domain-containing protein n=1 Tax=Tritrichomonas foetus TaxID=1144522 RepID=A0A1J4K9P7_9EUKA|nr:hypothetical protein TRFO_25538 [Tritrichomonas foetus]|eukprot:OHT06428.1 hypothetical protein TRFO_25538 [Tritrichomonas foetus]
MIKDYGYNPIQFTPYQYAPQPSFAIPVQQCSQKRHIFNAPPKKSNALFIKNLPYNMSSNEFMKIFEQYGEIATSSLHISHKGIAFVTYYDIRSAEAAKNGLRDFTAYGRHPVIDFSYKPPNYSKIDPREYSSLIKIIASSTITKDSIQNELSKFGEISEIKDIEHNTFKVLFYDFRCAHNACKSRSILISGINCQCEVYVENDNSVIYNNTPPFYNFPSNAPPHAQYQSVCPGYQPPSPPYPPHLNQLPTQNLPAGYPYGQRSPVMMSSPSSGGSPHILPAQEIPSSSSSLNSSSVTQMKQPHQMQQAQPIQMIPRAPIVPPRPIQQQMPLNQTQNSAGQMTQQNQNQENIKETLKRLQALLLHK